jgi:hypothetical protein
MVGSSALHEHARRSDQARSRGSAWPFHALTGLKSSGSWPPTLLAISQTMNQMTVMSGPRLRLRVSPRATAVSADGLSTTSAWHRGALRDHQLEPPYVDSVLRRKPCLARKPVRCRTAQLGESHEPAGSSRSLLCSRRRSLPAGTLAPASAEVRSLEPTDRGRDGCAQAGDWMISTSRGRVVVVSARATILGVNRRGRSARKRRIENRETRWRPTARNPGIG